ncbi:hypothetical protein SVIOM74S_09252 [Streptomyces violarus]
MQPGRHGIAPNQPVRSTRRSSSARTGSAVASGLSTACRSVQVTCFSSKAPPIRIPASYAEEKPPESWNMAARPVVPSAAAAAWTWAE